MINQGEYVTNGLAPFGKHRVSRTRTTPCHDVFTKTEGQMA